MDLKIFHHPMFKEWNSLQLPYFAGLPHQLLNKLLAHLNSLADFIPTQSLQTKLFICLSENGRQKMAIRNSWS